jgi:hypothetical protein
MRISADGLNLIILIYNDRKIKLKDKYLQAKKEEKWNLNR